MAIKGDITIKRVGGGYSEYTLPDYGRTLSLDTIEGGRSRRTFDGTLKTDIVYEKMKITISYTTTTATNVDALLTYYRLHESLELKIYTSPSTWVLSADGALPLVRLKPISKERFVQSSDGHYYRRVTIDMEEV